MTLQHALTDRLIRYAKINTQSNPESETTPTTQGQLVLAELLTKELNEIGMEEVHMDENGYVMASLPANTDTEVPTIGFMAHVDTATDFTGENVNPQVWLDYDGNDLLLNEAKHIVMSVKEYPELKRYIEHTLITSDGTTLLGADDKAGISEIMTAMEYLLAHPEIPHGKIRVAFTPDEEIGRGPHKFSVDRFAADLAYTVDGGPLGELQYENFNAASAKITIKGNNVHPGTAKGKMVHSVKIAKQILDHIPAKEAPEYTEGYEGFYHLLSFNGDTEQTNLEYIIRDFDKNAFEERKDVLKKIVTNLQTEYGKDAIHLEMEDQYYNMREKVEPVMEVVNTAEEAMNNLQIHPIIEPIRGGTDGAQISYMGLPTPNLFTGGQNFHGKFEFISVQDMEKAVLTIVEISKLFAQRG